jgi:hypothetical protein
MRLYKLKRGAKIRLVRKHFEEKQSEYGNLDFSNYYGLPGYILDYDNILERYLVYFDVFPDGWFWVDREGLETF